MNPIKDNFYHTIMKTIPTATIEHITQLFAKCAERIQPQFPDISLVVEVDDVNKPQAIIIDSAMVIMIRDNCFTVLNGAETDLFDSMLAEYPIQEPSLAVSFVVGLFVSASLNGYLNNSADNEEVPV